MTTILKVKPSNGTLKMKNEKNTFLSIFAGFLLAFIAITGMSFTTDDITRASDTAVKTSFKNMNAAGISGNQDLVNISPVGNPMLTNADRILDLNFLIKEKQYQKMAAAFGKTITSEATESDEIMDEVFMLNALVPAYSKSLIFELETADEMMDVRLNEDAELNAKTAAYKKSMINELNSVDAAIDVQAFVNNSSTVKPSIAAEADRLMDAQLNIQQLSPASASDADCKLDELINKN